MRGSAPRVIGDAAGVVQRAAARVRAALNGYLSKPIDRRALRPLLRQVAADAPLDDVTAA